MAKNYLHLPHHELGRATERLKLVSSLTAIQFEYHQKWPSMVSRKLYEDILESEPGEIFDWSDIVNSPSAATSLEVIQQQRDRLESDIRNTDPEPDEVEWSDFSFDYLPETISNEKDDIDRRERKSRFENVKIQAKDTLIIDN